MLFGKKQTTILSKLQRGLVFEKGSYKKFLMPGEYEFSGDENVSVFSVTDKFSPTCSFLEISDDKQLMDQLFVCEVADHELLIRKEDGKFAEVLLQGRHMFWKTSMKQEFIRVDLNKTEIEDTFDSSLLSQAALQPFLSVYAIAVNQIGILIVDNQIKRVLEAGTYVFWKNPNPASRLVKPQYEVELASTLHAFKPSRDLNYYLGFAPLAAELEVVDILDHQLVLHFEDEKFKDVLTVGRYAFWKRSIKHTFITVDKNKPEIDATIDPGLLTNALVLQHAWYFFVEAHEKGLLIMGKNFQRVLDPGAYHFWKSPVAPSMIKVDMRLQQLEVNGQEIMTRDKVTLRINFVCQYKISDPVKAGLEIKDYPAQLYVVLQLALREYLGSQSLDEILDKKEAISTYVAEKVKAQAGDLGLEITWSGIKDVILPGEIKDILNQVLIAERKAQANVITRREETASTRSLLNTAKLMEENETLYKLKELEYIERISEKINQISLGGGSQMLEQLRDMLMPKNK